ncbi:uncharacterized protein LOC124368728 isoform X3 [Homalodisca vitripennis]|uniref:uncharacterized protein LOC124368728 isoform X3 n=1 Tax=Homalodisca vitripennis TaxID=197043 RepID=UPI001EEB6D70|nr:uncharacterized protein LOC124368728 isoform X3 [Homalodisca vitripennis]
MVTTEMTNVVPLLFLLILPFFVQSQENWSDGKTALDPSPSVFSLGRSSEDVIDSSVRQPVLGSRTAADEFKISYPEFSKVDLQNSDLPFSYSSVNSLESITDNEIKNIEKRSVENSNIDEKLEDKINAYSVSVVDNDLDAPATDFSNTFYSTSILRDPANAEFYQKIQPTKSDDTVQQNFFSKTLEDNNYYRNEGEAKRASAKGRALPLPKPRSASDMDVQSHNSSLQTSSHRSDKPSPDIHDIINGFVKLLNGNVQVQVNTNNRPFGGRPLYPVRTRINNRGPPRITDVPPIDFDPPVPSRPSMGSKPPHPLNNLKIPPPYPFDIPPPISSLPPQPSVIRPFLSGIPLPEQIVPKDPNTISITSESNIPLENFNKSYIAPSKTKFSPFGNEYQKTKPGSLINNETDPVKETMKKPIPYKPTNSFIQPSEITPLTTPTLAVIQNKDPIYNESTSIQPGTTSLLEQNMNNTSHQSIKPNSDPGSRPGMISVNVSTSVFSVDNSSLSTKEEGLSIIDNKHITTTIKTTTPKTTPKPSTPKPTTPKPTTVEISSNKPPTVSKPSTPLIESSMAEVSTPDPQKPQWGDSTSSTSTTPLQSETNFKYYPRPGIVLDDPEYKPGGGSMAYQPIVTAPVALRPTSSGEVFDVTVSAIQGPSSSNTGHPYIYPVDIEGVQVGGAGSGEVSVITTAEAGQHFVSIDGKRTYINLFNSSPSVAPTASKKQSIIKPTGTYSVGKVGNDYPQSNANKRPVFHRRPAHPPVRIDTCIVGDDSTCDKAQNERCRTEVGVSSCHCRPGYSRRKHREPCIRVVSIVMSLRVDRMYDQRLTWTDKLRDKDSPEYLHLEYESSNAIESAMQMTPFSDEFLGCRVNSLYTVPSRHSTGLSPVYVNLTLQLEESAETLRPAIKKDIQRHLLGVIHRRSNNIGSSSLWVDSPAGSVSQLEDLDECQHTDLHDCHLVATCSNTFGSFHCVCPEGYRDPWAGNNHHSGRECHTCPQDFCNHRGECRYQNDQPVCKCAGSYYGAQCEIDGEVLGVAIGASVAAVIIIVSTLVCLCMWSRRWSREQKVAAGMGSPVFGYMATTRNNTIKTPAVGTSPYQVSLEDRLRWAQIADVMAQATNHYAPEPGGIATRPSSTIFGYGGTLPHLSAPIPMPRLSLRPASVHGTRAADSSCSEEEDRTDLLGRNFHVPRPKSRSSVANQSGIYYDVDYEQQPVPTCIPMNTYTMSNRSNYYCT